MPCWRSRQRPSKRRRSSAAFLGVSRSSSVGPPPFATSLSRIPTITGAPRPPCAMLRPLLGNGLLLSDSEEWKYQRRTVAPAFAPRTIPLLAAHVARATEAAVAKLAASAGQPVDLLTEMQALALEIAGTSMFSLAMGRYRPALRDLITGYTAHLGRPGMLDIALPRAIPTWRDLAPAIVPSALAGVVDGRSPRGVRYHLRRAARPARSVAPGRDPGAAPPSRRNGWPTRWRR